MLTLPAICLTILHPCGPHTHSCRNANFGRRQLLKSKQTFGWRSQIGVGWLLPILYLNQRCTSPDADEQQPNTTTVVLKSRLCAGLSSSSKTSFWGCLSTHRQAKPLLQTQKYAKSVIESCSRRRSQNKWTAPHKPNKAWLNDPVCSDLLFTRGGEWTRSWLSSLLLTRWT